MVYQENIEGVTDAVLAKKAEIAKEQVEFLGLKIDQRGIEMQPHICEKIINFPDKITTKMLGISDGKMGILRRKIQTSTAKRPSGISSLQITF